jgi:hypothetical protein
MIWQIREVDEQLQASSYELRARKPATALEAFYKILPRQLPYLSVQLQFKKSSENF